MVQFCKPYGFSKDSNVTLPALLEILPDDLKLFGWDGFPKKWLPLDLNPKNIVKLDIPHSDLKHLFNCYCHTVEKSA